MKKFLSIFLMLFLCLSLASVTFADHPPRLVDNGNLIDDGLETALTAELDRVSLRYDFDIVVVTVETLNGKDRVAYADDFYDYNGYGLREARDGILLLLSPFDDVIYVSTCGRGISLIDDNVMAHLSSAAKPSFKAGDYVSCVSRFTSKMEDVLLNEENGVQMKAPVKWGRNILIALAVGAVIAIIIVFVLKAQMKSVRSNPYASAYVRPDSMNVAQSNDVYLYSNVSKTARPKDNDSSGGGGSHVSSSGTSHGGGDL